MEKEVISQPRLERYPDAKPSISLPAPTGFLHPFARIYRRIPSCLSQLFERYAKIPQHWETRPPIERTFILREKNPRDFVTALVSLREYFLKSEGWISHNFLRTSILVSRGHVDFRFLPLFLFHPLRASIFLFRWNLPGQRSACLFPATFYK